MNDPARESADRLNAYAAARSGICPACENQLLKVDWGDNPDGSSRLLYVSCTVCDYMWPRAEKPKKDIFVTVHAVDRYRQRVQREGRPSGIPHGPDAIQIAGMVREALAAGRQQNHKSKRYMLWGHKRSQLPDGQAFVYTEDQSYAWIIKRDGEQWIVVTTLTPTISVEAA